MPNSKSQGDLRCIAYIQIKNREYILKVKNPMEARTVAEFLRKKHGAENYELRVSGMPRREGTIDGHGSTIRKVDAQPQQPLEEVKAQVREVRNMRVLVVEDEEDIRTMISSELERRGCEVSQAQNAKSALMLTDAQEFDIVISDLKMPGGDGWELWRGLSKAQEESDEQIPNFFIMTGFSDDEILDQVPQDKVTVFKKPFDLRNMVDQVLKQDPPRRTQKQSA